MPDMRIDAIEVGERVRQDLGDIEGLAESIGDIGLLHPITITDEGKLLAGQRRLEAARRLGWDTVPVRVVGGQ
jgi:ParB family chromosome partitioning protein